MVADSAGAIATAPQEFMRQQQRTVPAAACRHLIVDGFGRVTVIGSRRTTVLATATLRAWARDEGTGHALLESLHWFADSARPDTVRVGADATGRAKSGRRGDDRAVRVDLRLEVPESADVRLTTDGDVRAEGTGALTVTASGPVSVAHVHGAAEIQSKTGRIDALDVAGALRAETASGLITARRVLGEAILQTPAGLILAEDVHGDTTLSGRQGRLEARRIGGGLRGRTENGSITVADVRGACDLESRNGRIRVTHVRGDSLAVKTMAGGITIRQPEATTCRYDISSRFGRIDVHVPPSASLSVSLSSQSGRVDSPLPMTAMERDPAGHRLSGILGGGQLPLKATSQTGNIRLSGI